MSACWRLLPWLAAIGCTIGALSGIARAQPALPQARPAGALHVAPLGSAEGVRPLSSSTANTIPFAATATSTPLPVTTATVAEESPPLPVVLAQWSDVPTWGDRSQPIELFAGFSQVWADGATQVYLLRDQVQVKQGNTTISADQMIVWRMSESLTGTQSQLAIYAEGQVQLEAAGDRRHPGVFFGRMNSDAGISNYARRSFEQSGQDEPLMQRALDIRRQAEGEVQTVAFQDTPIPTLPGPVLIPFDQLGTPAPAAQRRVVITSRSSLPLAVSTQLSENTDPPEQEITITQGVRVLIYGMPGGVLDLSADNAMIWARSGPDGQFDAEMYQSPDMPLQIYLEGNIEVRQAERFLRASQAFYDIRENRALLRNAELRNYVPELDRDIRIRAGEIRQLSRDRFVARSAWVTASEFGKPGYRFEASEVFVENRAPQNWVGGPVPGRVDPQTGEFRERQDVWVTSLNNTFFFEEIPLLSLPTLTAPVDDANIPIRSLTIGQDGILGTQITTTWDVSRTLGLPVVPGRTWEADLSYYSERGPGLGTRYEYMGENDLGFYGPYQGALSGFYIHDDGEDNLGNDRRSLVPKDSNRGNLQLQHRQQLPYDMTLTGEFGYLSDRNFLEQYDEAAWDQDKDYETLLQLSQTVDQWRWSVLGSWQINDFEYGTEWLPRAELTGLSEPLLGGLLNWSTRSSLGYGKINVADTPPDPVIDRFDPLNYYADVEGLVAQTRHELSMPLDVGPLSITPYLLGEAAYWQEALDGSSLNRFYGSAGVRASLTFWKVFPWVQSEIFNLNGLAHKHELSADLYYADATAGLSEVAQYNEFDENAQERFRTRLLFNTFNSVSAPQFDPRRYAVRSGAGRGVSDPYFELVDSQEALRLNWRHRLETKVGPQEAQRIVDWMTLDLGLTYFPDADRDNFGESLGLLTASYNWRLGPRTRFLANSSFDTYDNAQQLWDVGLLNQRAGRGSLYVGYRQIEAGPLVSKLLNASTSYSLGPKWVMTAATSYDVGVGEDRGQSLTVSRLGKDIMVHFGASYDANKNNANFGISIEPIFGPVNARSTQLSSLLGIR